MLRLGMLTSLIFNSQHAATGWSNARLHPTIESLSMTFTTDGKRQKLPLSFYSFHVIEKCLLLSTGNKKYFDSIVLS